MLGLDNDPIQAPAAAGTIADEAPPLPTGQLDAESVPQAVRKPPEPLIRIIMPVVMVAAIGAMVAIFALSGRGISPLMMLFPLMMIMGLLTTLNPPEKAGDIDESRRVYLRHLDALAERARSNAVQQREHVEFFHPAPGTSGECCQRRARVGARCGAFAGVRGACGDGEVIFVHTC